MSESERYASFSQYILGITYEIWEEKGVEKIKHYYHDDVVVRSPDGLVLGNQSVVDATYKTLEGFPDRELLGEDVIWARTGENSWLSSHRILSKATHLGLGNYGEPTGKKVVYRIIADCHVTKHEKYGWVINDEWLVRDQGAIYKQLDLSYESQTLSWDPVTETDPLGLSYDGPYQGKGNQVEPVPKYAEHLHSIMAGDFACIAKNYNRACQLEICEGKTIHGIDEAEKFWINLRGSFPEAKFTIEHQIGQTEDNLPPRAAIRWRLTGNHTGNGMFGAPSGKFVDILGISHAEYGRDGIMREFILIDPVSIWSQIYRN